MKHKLLLTFTSVFVISCAIGIGNCLGNNDLDDKISKYTDDPIYKDDELGKAIPNVRYIILDAMSKAKKRDDSTENSIVIHGDANNSTIVNIVNPAKKPANHDNSCKRGKRCRACNRP